MIYVVQCHKKVRRVKVGLGGPGWYLPGQYVTYKGHPTRNIEQAHIYNDRDAEESFPFDELFGDTSTGTDLKDFFKRVPVKLKVVRRVTKAR